MLIKLKEVQMPETDPNNTCEDYELHLEAEHDSKKCETCRWFEPPRMCKKIPENPIA